MLGINEEDQGTATLTTSPVSGNTATEVSVPWDRPTPPPPCIPTVRPVSLLSSLSLSIGPSRMHFSSPSSSFFAQRGGGICLNGASEADCTGCHFADNSAPSGKGKDLYFHDSGDTFTASSCPPDAYTGTVDGTLDVAGANSGTYNSYTCTPIAVING